MKNNIALYLFKTPSPKEASDLVKALAIKDFFGEEVSFSRTEVGKPYFPEKQDFEISVSHSGEIIVCAITKGKIGVDIEEIRDAFPKRISSLLSEEELPVGQLFALWVRKEAEGKMLGGGVFERLKKPFLKETHFIDVSREVSLIAKKPFSAVIATDKEREITVKELIK